MAARVVHVWILPSHAPFAQLSPWELELQHFLGFFHAKKHQVEIGLLQCCMFVSDQNWIGQHCPTSDAQSNAVSWLCFGDWMSHTEELLLQATTTIVLATTTIVLGLHNCIALGQELANCPASCTFASASRRKTNAGNSGVKNMGVITCFAPWWPLWQFVSSIAQMICKLFFNICQNTCCQHKSCCCNACSCWLLALIDGQDQHNAKLRTALLCEAVTHMVLLHDSELLWCRCETWLNLSQPAFHLQLIFFNHNWKIWLFSQCQCRGCQFQQKCHLCHVFCLTVCAMKKLLGMLNWWLKDLQAVWG